ncbi:MAG: calcium-translocating P-type ATPase, PMCA-type [Mucinivorans sp.]
MKLSGLSNQQVEENRKKFGANTLTPPPKEPLWKLFLDKFSDPVIRILLVAAFLSLGISVLEGQYAETIGIFAAIFLSTGVAFFFEMDAARKFDVLNQVNDDTLYKVVREGGIVEVGKKELVVGDVVLLDTGEEIPADGLLLEATALSVNESTLTGEPSIRKTTCEQEFKADATYPSNMLLRGTSIIEGNATMEIERVGDATEFGKVARQATINSGERTPLDKQLARLAKLIGVVGFSLAIVTFIGLFVQNLVRNPLPLGQLGLLGAAMISAFIMLAKIWVPIVYDAREIMGSKKERSARFEQSSVLHWIYIGLLFFMAISVAGIPFGVKFWESGQWVSLEQAGRILQYFMVAVTLIVVAVPEGLPMSVTLSLALSMRKMLQNNNLVRKMHACETMGATTVICTDKTGTLTQNQMSVYQMYQIVGDDLSVAIASNTTANLDATGKPLGNPTEGALLLWLKSQGVDYAGLRNKIVSQLPFSSKQKFMATVVGDTLYVKGAPEYVLKMCSVVDNLAQVERVLLDFQNKAMRTLAFASKKVENVDSKTNLIDLANGLTLNAIAAISDPVRDDVPAAVAQCQAAGVAVKVVTGDTPATAREIARQIGLWLPTDGAMNEITGPEWEALSDIEAYERAAHLKIMARARPMDKQRLVSLLQKRGEVVAVTGDGTNDAPALNFANVGLSMGSGTSVAKEASDITLLDDSFASIATAVMWGRSVYLNIQRFVLFQLTINVAALTLVFLGSMLGFELPLTVTQMLWVNLIMDTFAAGALASLPPSRRVMGEKPRRSTDFIITRIMGRSIIGVGLAFVVVLMGLLYWFQHSMIEFTMEYKLSMFFTIFVMLQFWNMFNAKAYHSGGSALKGLVKAKGFLLVALLILVGQILIVSFGGDVFRVVPLEFSDWLIIIGATSLVLWIGEIGRLFGKGKK